MSGARKLFRGRGGAWRAAVAAAALLCFAGCGGPGAAPSDAEPAVDGLAAAGSAAIGATATAAEAEGEAHRIVATTVAITEIMDRLDLELVGVPTSVKTLPKRYDDVTRVGNPMSPDLERVRSLRPTDVLSVTTLQYDLGPVFENAKVEGTFLDLTSLERMKSEIVRLGDKYDRTEQAAAIVAEYDESLTAVRAAADGKPQPTVLILLGVPGSYLVATEHSYIGDLVRLAGGVNIVQGEQVEFLASNTEYLQQSNPDVILRAAHGMPEEVVKMFDEEFKKNDIWRHFKAVQTGRVYDLEERLFGTTGNLAVGEALEALLPMLYPEST